MKLLALLICLILGLGAVHADDNLLLVDQSSDEILIIKGAEIEEVIDEDRELLEDDFLLPEWVSLDVRGSATLMAIRGNASIGAKIMNGRFEAGLDTGATFIMAGVNGAFSPEVGVYTKFRLTPNKEKTVYFKGRWYKAFNISEDAESTSEYGIGWENEKGTFIELSINHYQFNDGDQYFIPFISAGIKLDKTLKKKEKVIFDEEN